MVMPGECVNDTKTLCSGCNTGLEIQVCSSGAGYYVGFFCNQCGPYSRESGYYRFKEEAEIALETNNYWRI